MTIERLPLKQAIVKAVDHGFATHRVQQKIFHEGFLAVIDIILDAVEKELEDGKRDGQTKDGAKVGRATKTDGAHAA